MPGAGAQSRGLIISGRMKGWDPTKIRDQAGGPPADISQIDVDPAFNGSDPLGRIQAAPESRTSAANDQFTERVSFAAPDVGRENAQRHTTDADPYPGGGLIGSPPPRGGSAGKRAQNMAAQDTSDDAGDAPGLGATNPSGS